MIDLKCFSATGIAKVQATIEEYTSTLTKGKHGVPVTADVITGIMEMADDVTLLEETALTVQLDETKIFNSSFELGEYVHSLFDKHTIDAIDSGIWNWIAIKYFSQLVNYRKKDKKYLIGSSYKYLLQKSSRLRYYRHLVYMPCYLYSRLGEDSYIFLHSPAFESGEFLAQAQKDEVVSNRNMIAMCAKYFFDVENKKFAPGFTGKKDDPRSLRKLVSVVVPQLCVNYDIRYCDKDVLFKLLPDSLRDNSLV